MNILVVEDESLIALDMCLKIKSFGYDVVDYATNAKMAKNIFSQMSVDLIFMDVNLNDEVNGIELYKQLNTNIPLVYVTAYSDDKILREAASTEPATYLVKPVKNEELKAVLELIKYKVENKKTDEEKFVFDDFVFKDDKLFKNGEYIKLSKKELDLFKLLIHSDDVISFETLQDILWPQKEVSSTTIRTLVFRLKSKLDNQYIKTIYSLGVKFEV